jgi:hypothetical protein
VAVGYSRGSILLAKLLKRDKRINKAFFGGMGLDFTKPDWTEGLLTGDVFTGRTEPDQMTGGTVDYTSSLDVDFESMGHLQDHQRYVLTGSDFLWNSTSECRPLKSYRVEISLNVLFTALSTSCALISFTMPNDAMVFSSFL